ncbi:MAG: response regulator [Candidatus Diapherotrites archaeon]|nr:response regulator [Candidatus Diapherotrites archaeon]
MVDCKKQKILIVDDKLSVRMALKKQYECIGFEVFLSSSISEAKKLMQENKFDVVLTDLFFRAPKSPFSLPAGLYLCRWCRKNGYKGKLILHSTALHHTYTRPLFFWLKPIAKRYSFDLRRKSPLRKHVR